jgi:glutathionylspermidine synthase
MRRLKINTRSDWQGRVERVGLTYHTLADGSPYWDESACWEFTSGEIDRIEAATTELQKLALDAGDAIMDQDRLKQMGIPDAAAPAIRAAWNGEPPALYGRFDLAYDGTTIKLLEYNADTPTGLIEAAVAQWYWLKDCFPDADQFNSVHEKLIAKWKDLKDYATSPVYFAHGGAEEDAMTVSYLQDTAHQAGISTRFIKMNEIGWDAKRECFVDLQSKVIGTLFKLYPWEWLLREPFGLNALSGVRLSGARFNGRGRRQAGCVRLLGDRWRTGRNGNSGIERARHEQHELLCPPSVSLEALSCPWRRHLFIIHSYERAGTRQKRSKSCARNCAATSISTTFSTRPRSATPSTTR